MVRNERACFFSSTHCRRSCCCCCVYYLFSTWWEDHDTGIAGICEAVNVMHSLNLCSFVHGIWCITRSIRKQMRKKRNNRELHANPFRVQYLLYSISWSALISFLMSCLFCSKERSSTKNKRRYLTYSRTSLYPFANNNSNGSSNSWGGGHGGERAGRAELANGVWLHQNTIQHHLFQLCSIAIASSSTYYASYLYNFFFFPAIPFVSVPNT